ncbi:MAG: hypothetical protein JNK82_22525 [Myxococcaceae bacterium]|nr:hypothetical protein [Myxococcaceae bacterium]
MTTISRGNAIGQPIASPSDTTIPKPAAGACAPVDGVAPDFVTATGTELDDGWKVDLRAQYDCDGFEVADQPFEVRRDVEGPAEQYTEIMADRNRDGLIDGQQTYEVIGRDAAGADLAVESLMDVDYDQKADLESINIARIAGGIPG